jgi:arabinose-5-phosphate isomerase
MVESNQTLDLARNSIMASASAIQGLVAKVDDSFVQAVDRLLNCRGHVITSGVGTTGTIAHRLAHLLCNVGCPSLFLHAADSLHGGSGALKDGDVLVIISKTGETRETRQLAEMADARQIPIIAITARAESTIAGLSQVVLLFQTPAELDPYEGLMGVGSSLAAAALCDALVMAVLYHSRASRQRFIEGHPGGAIEQLDEPAI